MPTQATTLPVHTVRHRGLKAAIWRNETDKGPMFNVTITRSYKERSSGEWRDTQNIGYDDLMNLAGLMYQAHSFISALIAKGPVKGRATPSPR